MSKQYEAYQTWGEHGIEQGMKVKITSQEKRPNGYITFSGDVNGKLTANEFHLTFFEATDLLERQDLNRLRNAIHNEAGVTKQEIRDMVEQAVTHLVEKRVKQLLPDKISLDKMVDKAIEERSLYYWNDDGKRFSSEIADNVSKRLIKKISIDVKVK